jgi:hypothetical protein
MLRVKIVVLLVAARVDDCLKTVARGVDAAAGAAPTNAAHPDLSAARGQARVPALMRDVAPPAWRGRARIPLPAAGGGIDITMKLGHLPRPKTTITTATQIEPPATRRGGSARTGEIAPTRSYAQADEDQALYEWPYLHTGEPM